MVTKNVSELIDNEYKEYAMYVLENRALPSYIDGLKPSGRKLLYSMLNYYKGKKTKIAELGTSISQFNYHHGESSAMGAAITLASDWNNNIPLFEGHGNFGSRLIPVSAAPRYIYASLSNDFEKYFCDHDVVDSNIDMDNPEPQQYLPVIPWSLVNGIEGIAVGFACKFLPHDPKEIAKACILAMNNKLKDDYVLSVKFPSFKGKVVQEEYNKVTTYGIIENTKRNTWEISELPIGYDREKYFNILDKMLSKNEINDFEDCCDENGFKFIVKLDKDAHVKCTEDPITYFKLSKSITENYNALDEKGKIIQFNNKNEIIQRFVKFRVEKVKAKIEFDINKLNTDISYHEVKLKFIESVISKKINLMKFRRADLIEHCMNSYNIEKDIAQKLSALPIYDMTSDMLETLKHKIEEMHKELNDLNAQVPSQTYINMLKKI